MKNILYRSLLAFLVCIAAFLRADAQYYFTSGSYAVIPDTAFCQGPTFYLTTSAYAPSLQVLTYLGNGTSVTHPVSISGSGGQVTFSYPYSAAGTYTVKHVLLNGTARVDSLIDSREYRFCKSFITTIFNDINGDGYYNPATEKISQVPFTIEVSKSGVPIDTFQAISGFYYTVHGVSGEVFGFRILSPPGGMVVTCPSSGVIYDTIHATINNYSAKYLGWQCVSAAPIDLGVTGTVRSGRNFLRTTAIVSNVSCTPQNATLVMHCSPKYGSFDYADPTPASVVGNTITWNLTGLSFPNPVNVQVKWYAYPWLTAGDTVHTEFSVTPVIGDIDPTNNSIILIDTVTGAFDPNDKAVKPEGYIDPGTKLTYTVRFENTGNDTAFNIHIMDTLSDNLDVRSLDVVASSAVMNLHLLTDGPHNVVKFDFPSINLLDSSHHFLNTGMVMFSIKTKPGLAVGTGIDNRAGIYFDYNEPILTNTVHNEIGGPAAVAEMSNVPDFSAYPNPVHDVLSIDVENGRYQSVDVANAVGQVLLNRAVNAPHMKLDVSALPVGIYILTLRGEHGVQVKKFEKL